MGTILQFARRTESAPRSAELDDAIRGMIVIFPGVRIERHGAEIAPKGTAPQARKKTQRDRKKQRR